MFPPMRPSPIIASCIALSPLLGFAVPPFCPNRRSSLYQPECPQLLPECLCPTKQNYAHPERPRRREILISIVDHQRSRGIHLRHAERAVIDLARRLACAEPARTEERREDLTYSEMLDAIRVQLLRFVVERHEAHATTLRDRPRLRDAVRPGL